MVISDDWKEDLFGTTESPKKKKEKEKESKEKPPLKEEIKVEKVKQKVEEEKPAVEEKLPAQLEKTNKRLREEKERFTVLITRSLKRKIKMAVKYSPNMNMTKFSEYCFRKGLEALEDRWGPFPMIDAEDEVYLSGDDDIDLE